MARQWTDTTQLMLKDFVVSRSVVMVIPAWWHIAPGLYLSPFQVALVTV